MQKAAEVGEADLSSMDRGQGGAAGRAVERRQVLQLRNVVVSWPEAVSTAGLFVTTGCRDEVCRDSTWLNPGDAYLADIRSGW